MSHSPVDHAAPDHSHVGHQHAKGMTSFILEYVGHTIVNGEDENTSFSEMLVGASYHISELTELRVGYQFPVGKPRELDKHWIAGFILHF